jgi:hypothetical protein
LDRRSLTINHLNIHALHTKEFLMDNYDVNTDPIMINHLELLALHEKEFLMESNDIAEKTEARKRRVEKIQRAFFIAQVVVCTVSAIVTVKIAIDNARNSDDNEDD